MNKTKKVAVNYFTDVLCIWAYIAQVRVNELKSEFSNQLDFDYHFFPVFGDVFSKMQSRKDGIEGYSKHVHDVCLQFDHIKIHPELWKKNIPTTSLSIHTFLKALQILEDKEILSKSPQDQYKNNTIFEEFLWCVRTSFFEQAVDISQTSELFKIAQNLEINTEEVSNVLNSGEATAKMYRDMQLKEKFKIPGSPSYVLNSGRQILYGNIGYRLIKSNICELLETPHKDYASWC